MNRRSFTFASLASFATVAQAAAPEADRAQASVEGRWAAAISQGVLTITLGIHNASSAPIEALVRMGSRPAPQVCASLVVDHHEVALAAVAREMDMRELMSRMGPMPTYEVVADGADLALGSYAFTLPAGAGTELIRATATIETVAGPVVLAYDFTPADVARG